MSVKQSINCSGWGFFWCWKQDSADLRILWKKPFRNMTALVTAHEHDAVCGDTNI